MRFEVTREWLLSLVVPLHPKAKEQQTSPTQPTTSLLLVHNLSISINTRVPYLPPLKCPPTPNIPLHHSATPSTKRQPTHKPLPLTPNLQLPPTTQLSLEEYAEPAMTTRPMTSNSSAWSQRPRSISVWRLCGRCMRF